MPFAMLDDEEEKAKKYLGKAAEFPPQKVDIRKLGETQGAAYDAFTKARDDMGNLISQCETANEAILVGLKRLADGYEKSDFGLDPKKKDDLKKIKQAQKQFSTFFDGLVKELETSNKGFEEVEKHLVQMSKYKSPPKQR